MQHGPVTARLPLMRAGLLTLILLLLSTVAEAATYYVRTDGNNANAGTSNTAGGAWRTIDFASDNVAAGDTIRVQAGTYAEMVTPSDNGSAASPITFVADGAVSVREWTFANNNYIRMIGFTVDRDSPFIRCVSLTGTNTGIEFWHNTFRDCGYGIAHAQITDRLNNSLIIGNVFLNLGVGDGGGAATVTQGTHNIFAYNEGNNLHPDMFAINGTQSRWTNNYLHHVSEASGGHSDYFQFGSHALGLAHNIFEANFQEGVGTTSDEHTAILQNYDTSRCAGGVASGCGPVTENLWRRNVWHNVGSGTLGIAYAGVSNMTFNRLYSNTEAGINRLYPTATYGIAWFNGVDRGFIRNNIAFEAWGPSAVRNLEVYHVEGALDIDYNLAFDPDGAPQSFAAPWTRQANPRTQVNPQFVNYAADDFTLGATSGARDTGGPLTTTVGSGTGTTFNVAAGTGGAFRGRDTTLTQYGGNITAGDVITVGTDVLTVASVSGDAVTVTTPFTWASGEPVYSGNDPTPDIGAFPYKAGGYTLTASYSQVGGTATVVPSDASLVRFVVCSQDGVPTTVDNASPYTCPVGPGVFSARAYPLYASKTLWAVATSGTGPPPPPPPPPPPTPPPLPVNCVTTPFSEWAATSAPGACVNNQQSVTEQRTRTVLVQPQNGGLACGPLSESRTVQQPCTTPPPPAATASCPTGTTEFALGAVRVRVLPTGEIRVSIACVAP